MRFISIIMVNSLLFLSTSLFAHTALAKGAELQFDSTVVSVIVTEPHIGTVTVTMTDFDVPLTVNGDTEIVAGGNQVSLEDITTGDTVRINAFLSDAGITAEGILILDSLQEQFRLQGQITEVRTNVESPNDDGMSYNAIELLGVQVYFNDDSEIVHRSMSDEAFTFENLAVNDRLDVHGYFDGALIAQTAYTGMRQVGFFEFDGIIDELLTDNTIRLALADGSSMTLLLTENSEVTGDLVVGAFVEVEGMLNADLQVEVHELVVDVDNDGDADDDHKRKISNGPRVIDNPNSTTVSALLTSPDGDTSLSGAIQISIAPNGQHLALTLSGSTPETQHDIHILVNGVAVHVDSVVSDDQGNASIVLQSQGNSPASLLFDMGTQLSELSIVEISVNGTVVLSGNLSQA